MMASSSTARRFVTTGRSWATGLTMLMLAAGLSAACSTRAIRPAATDDAGISTRVRTALLNDREVAANNINVTAASGIVTLSGSVRTAAERDRAVAVARQTSGVSDVRSDLAVSQP